MASGTDATVESVELRPSGVARFGTQALLLVVATVFALKVSGATAGSLAAGLSVLAFGAAVALPFALDLWSYVRGDARGVRWRNRLRRGRCSWDDIAAIEQGPTCMVLRRTDGTTVPLRALGLRFLGSRKLARSRVAMLERARPSGPASQAELPPSRRPSQ